MLCPNCKAENTVEATECSQCGTKLKRRPRRRNGDDAASFWHQVGLRTGLAPLSFHLSLFGAIPGFGLVLGPVATVMALIALYRARKDDDIYVKGFARAGLIIGVSLWVTTWVGLYLMIAGWGAN
jgi:hypothetical protein